MKQTLPRRRSTRLPDFDYTQPGAYFVTVCVKNWKTVLSTVVEEKTILTQEGQTVLFVWNDLPTHYSYVKLDEFVVMPNHTHGIIWIEDELAEPVGAGFKPAPTTKPHGLPEIVRAFKTFSARKINERRNTPSVAFWQRNYYEHIIRDDEDLFQHRKYILDNPLKWHLDEYNRQQP